MKFLSVESTSATVLFTSVKVAALHSSVSFWAEKKNLNDTEVNPRKPCSVCLSCWLCPYNCETMSTFWSLMWSLRSGVRRLSEIGEEGGAFACSNGTWISCWRSTGGAAAAWRATQAGSEAAGDARCRFCLVLQGSAKHIHTHLSRAGNWAERLQGEGLPQDGRATKASKIKKLRTSAYYMLHQTLVLFSQSHQTLLYIWKREEKKHFHSLNFSICIYLFQGCYSM